jgi:cytochrome c551/c552
VAWGPPSAGLFEKISPSLLKFVYEACKYGLQPFSYTLLNDQPLVKFEPSVQRILVISLVVSVVTILVALGVVQIREADPYVQDVLARAGDAGQGQAIFQLNCAGCHGLMGDGKVGPSLRNVSARKSQWRLIQQVISGKTPPMPQFQPSPQEMADLLSYLESL